MKADKYIHTLTVALERRPVIYFIIRKCVVIALSAYLINYYKTILSHLINHSEQSF